jgi:hypothetical protein
MDADPKIKPDHPCLACGKPLADDEYAQENESGCCGECCDTRGTLFEVLSYFLVPLLDGPLICSPPRGGEGVAKFVGEVPWPDVKRPDLWHTKACLLYAGWGAIVSQFKKLFKTEVFSTDELRSLLRWMKAKGMTDEQIILIKRSDLLRVLREANNPKSIQKINESELLDQVIKATDQLRPSQVELEYVRQGEHHSQR